MHTRKQAYLQGLKWEFAVIDSDQVNAFVVPGGKVVVYTGLLKLLQGPAMETQVAAVLGHEIAHVVARHSVRTLTVWICVPAVLFTHMHTHLGDVMGSSPLLNGARVILAA